MRIQSWFIFKFLVTAKTLDCKLRKLGILVVNATRTSKYFFTYASFQIFKLLLLFILLSANLGLVLYFNVFVQYSQSGSLPLRPLCGDAPGRDSNLGWVDLVAGTLTTRPPHLTLQMDVKTQSNRYFLRN